MRTPPVASYRLQLHGEFTFADAARALPYIAGLGVSHLYLSPIFTAAPGSTHGYDVYDPREVNPVLGGSQGLDALLAALEQRGMFAILDIVPNHVGVAGAGQPWWRDVLRWGRDSTFAHFFDIDWEARGERPADALCLAVLGATSEEAIRTGDLKLSVHDGEPGFDFGAWIPLAPETYGELCDVSALMAEAAGRAMPRVPAAAHALAVGPIQAREQALASTLQAFRGEMSDDLQTAIDAANRAPKLLEQLLAKQHYWLANWRTVGVELNYRRFFAIDDLAAVRVEDERVFEYTHALILELAAHPAVAGLRVDHVDGLYDPAGYLERLRARLDALQGPRRTIHVEKILARGEALIDAWPIEGETGYAFLAQAGGLFVDAGAEEAMTAGYEAFTSLRRTFEHVETVGRDEFVRTEFVAERERLLRQVLPAIEGSAPTAEDLREALTLVLGGMRRYRTYLVHGKTTAEDAQVLAAALAHARSVKPGLEDALRAIEAALHPERDAERAATTAQRVRFRRRFDQVAGAVAAKGVEDTAFYRYSRLIALNEVGGTPDAFGTSPEALHAWLAERARAWPFAMSASSTHDTKRDEDVRARIAVLSEIPEEWAREVAAWREMNAGYRLTVHGEGSPLREREYYLYQTLVGSWEGHASERYRERIVAHLLKAMREAKQRTTWIDPADAYERAARDFVSLILADQAFVQRLDRFVVRIAPAGRLNALSALVLKVMAPGFPDFYQGTESPTHSLTDPDNRRPVDFATLAAEIPREQPNIDHPRFKQWLTRQLLRARRELGEVTGAPEYEPLPTMGEHAERLFGFHRGKKGRQFVTVVPRLAAGLVSESAAIAGERWGDTTVSLPKARHGWRNMLTGEPMTKGKVRCEQLLARLPFAVLADVPGGRA